jgi:hypothetical protein
MLLNALWRRHFGSEMPVVDCVWNVMAHAQKPDFVFRRNGRVHLNRRERRFGRLLAGELCTSACRVCTACASLCSAVMWHLLASHSILLFPLHFSSRESPCAITFQLDSTFYKIWRPNLFDLSRQNEGNGKWVEMEDLRNVYVCKKGRRGIWQQ